MSEERNPVYGGGIHVGAGQSPSDPRGPRPDAQSKQGDVRTRAGDQSNHAQVDQPGVPGHVKSDAPAIPAGAETINTTHGPATLHTTVSGQRLVTLPNGAQYSLAQATEAGLLTVAALGAQTGEDGDNTDGDPKAKDAPEDAPAVDVDMAKYAEQVNALSEPLRLAGFPEDSAADALAGDITLVGEGEYEISERLETILVEKYGEEGADQLVSQGIQVGEKAALDWTKANVSEAQSEGFMTFLHGARNDPALAKEAARATMNAAMGNHAPLHAFLKKGLARRG